MYWFTVPAIMKGWMDRVLTLGFAFTHEKRYSQGIFKVTKQIKRFASLLSCLSLLTVYLVFFHRTRRPCSPSPLGLRSPCSVQMASMET